MKRLVNGVEVELSEESFEVNQLPDRLAVRAKAGTFTAIVHKYADRVYVSFKGCQYTVEKAALRSIGKGRQSSGELHAPMPGLIVDVLVAEGAEVSKGERLVVLEAMKTQQSFQAPFDGIVERLPVRKGEQVVEGALLALVVARESGLEQTN